MDSAQLQVEQNTQATPVQQMEQGQNVQANTLPDTISEDIGDDALIVGGNASPEQALTTEQLTEHLTEQLANHLAGTADKETLAEVQETNWFLSNVMSREQLNTTYDMLGVAGVVLLLLALVACYLALKNMFYLGLVWGQFKKGFVDIEENECRSLDEIVDSRKNNPLLRLIREVMQIKSKDSTNLDN